MSPDAHRQAVRLIKRLATSFAQVTLDDLVKLGLSHDEAVEAIEAAVRRGVVKAGERGYVSTTGD